MKTNKIILLFFAVAALASCSKEATTNVGGGEEITTGVNLTLTLDNNYSDQVESKAGGSKDIPLGYNLVANLQVYECDSDGVVASYPIYSTSESVEGNDVDDDDQLLGLDIFNSINLVVDNSYKVFAQFYYAPQSAEDVDIYTFDADSKLYTRNYERRALGDDAEDFYAGTTTLTLDPSGEVIDSSLDIMASRTVSKMSVEIEKLNYCIGEDANTSVIDLKVDAAYDMGLVYTDFSIPSYNYYTNDVEYVSDSVEEQEVYSTAIYGSLSDYIFIPSDGIDFRVHCRTTAVPSEATGSVVSTTDYFLYNEEEYRSIFMDISNVNRIYKVVSGDTDGVYTGLCLYNIYTISTNK